MKPQPDLASGSKWPARCCMCVRGHTGVWEHQRGCESTVWVRTTAWEQESESAQPPQRRWLRKGGEASEAWRMVPRQSQRQVPTHPMDSLPGKSCLNLRDDTPRR